MSDAGEFAEFEALARAVQSGGAADGGVRAALDEFERRRLLWRHIAGRAPLAPTYHSSRAPVATVSFFSFGRYYLALLMAVVAVVVGLATRPVWGCITGVLGLGGVIAWQGWATWHRWRRLDSAECLKCGYDMRGIPSAIDPARSGGRDLGPRRCPECGRAWPRIPARDGSGRG